MHIANNPPKLLLILLLCSTILTSCSTSIKTSNNFGLPVLTQEELTRPYRKLGRIKVTRETFTTDLLLTPDIKEWGLSAVRQEAEKMGADAIMLLEVTGRTTAYGVFPSTEFQATGFAIKFE